jgi:2-methylcitrate dehydratase PrpD
LKAEAIVRAFGLAACQASGLMAWESDPTENARPFQMGVAARNGVTAALLAQRSFGGPTGVFDFGHTIFRAFSRKADPEKLVSDIGRRWDGVLELAVKPYPCVAFLHPALDAVFEVMGKDVSSPEDVRSIVMKFPRAGSHCVDGNPLKSHCAQYILAVAIANGELNVADIFEDQRLINPTVDRLSRLVKVGVDDELDKLFPDFYATIVEIETHSGARITRRKDIARGYPEAPMSPREIQQKFRTIVGKVRSEESIDQLLCAAAELEKVRDLNEYARNLRGSD